MGVFRTVSCLKASLVAGHAAGVIERRENDVMIS